MNKLRISHHRGLGRLTTRGSPKNSRKKRRTSLVLVEAGDPRLTSNTPVFFAVLIVILFSVNQIQKFGTGADFFTENAGHHRGGHHRILFLNTAHHHA